MVLLPPRWTRLKEQTMTTETNFEAAFQPQEVIRRKMAIALQDH